MLHTENRPKLFNFQNEFVHLATVNGTSTNQPSIQVDPVQVDQGRFVVVPTALEEVQAPILAQRINEVLGG